jgi:hypothetical protein
MNRFKELYDKVNKLISSNQYELFDYEDEKYELLEYLEFLDFEGFNEYFNELINKSSIKPEQKESILSCVKELEDYCNSAKNGNGSNMSDRKSKLLYYFRTYKNIRVEMRDFEIDLFNHVEHHPINSYDYEEAGVPITGEAWYEFAKKKKEITDKIELMEEGLEIVRNKIAFLLEGQTCSVIESTPTYLKPERVVDIFYFYLRLATQK